MNERLERLKKMGLAFGEGKRVETRNGPRVLYKAPAIPDFWTIWRDEGNKKLLKDAGFSVTKDEKTGTFYVLFWEKPADLAQVMAEREASVEASRAADCDRAWPSPEGRHYLPFQKAGINFALRRDNVLFGDEMGLGKTVQAIGVINCDTSLKKILIVCPNTLKKNWQQELSRWLVPSLSVGFATTAELPATDIVIVNYERCAKLESQLRAIEWDLLICDEAHLMKSKDAQRTKALLGRYSAGPVKIGPLPSRRKLFLTGTPIPNRPVEGWTLFHALWPNRFTSYTRYTKDFCAAHQGRWGWDVSGSSNLDLLQRTIREEGMVRRLKKDVLTELPPKVRQVIEFPANGALEVVEAEQAAWKLHESELAALRLAVEMAKVSEDPEVYRDAVAKLKAGVQAAFTEISRLRHETALAKVPYVVEFVRSSLDDNEGGKVVVFGHHKDVIAQLAEGLKDYGVVTMTGETTIDERDKAVTSFQNDPSTQVFIGGIMVAGIGLTLTASSRVVMAELDWVPGNVTQAEDRCHRIGQKDSVLVQHLVLEGSLDARMAEILVQKQQVLEAALDKQSESQPSPLASLEAQMPALPLADQLATLDLSIEKVIKDAEVMKKSPEKVSAIHRCLQILADMDEDHATELNGCGFSKMDVALGHRLAAMPTLSVRGAVLGERLCLRYHRQLPADLLAIIKGSK